MKQKFSEYIKSIDCSEIKSKLECEKKEKEKIPRKYPFPLAKLIAINSNVFVNQLSVILIFPFLPFMIHDFFPSLRRSELGKQAGFLGAAYFIGNLPGTIVLGLISDHFGRKWVLLLATLAGSGFEILFGFSRNFSWAVLSRTVWGFVDGNVGVTKAFISEVCEERDVGGGFAIFGAFHALGRVTGSIIGGTLARPASKYMAFELPFFCDFPYLLPCLVGAGLGLTAVVGGMIFIRESKRNKTVSESDKNASGRSSPISDSDSDTTALLELKSQENEEANDESSRRTQNGRLDSVRSKLDKLGKASGRNVKKILLQLTEKNVLLSIVFFSILSYVTIITIELLPLLLVNNFNHGGYKMDDTEIGVLMMVATIAHLPLQLILFPWLMSLVGYRNTFRIALFILFICNFLLPFSTAISGPVHVPFDYNETYLNSSEFCNQTSDLSIIRADSVKRITWNVWLWLVFINGINIAGRGMIIGCSAVFINNASLPSTRGTINGISQSVSSIGKMLAPLIGGPLFAWSENDGLAFPLNFHLLLNINCLILVGVFFSSFLLKKSIEHPRTENGSKRSKEKEMEKNHKHSTE